MNKEDVLELEEKNKYLTQEVDRLNSIVDSIEKYVERMSFGAVIDNPKKDLQKILRK